MKLFAYCSIILCSFLLAACQTAPATSDLATPIEDTRLPPASKPEASPHAVVLPLPPTTELSEADDYVLGQSDAPAGSYLFVEYADVNTQCAMYDEPVPVYSFNSDEGILRVGEGELPENAIGFYGLRDWGGYAMGLQPINQLPEQREIPILQIQADGTIAVEIDGAAYWLAPGESWKYTYDSRDCGGDWIDYAYQYFVNHGLLSVENVRYGERP